MLMTTATKIQQSTCTRTTIATRTPTNSDNKKQQCKQFDQIDWSIDSNQLNSWFESIEQLIRIDRIDRTIDSSWSNRKNNWFESIESIEPSIRIVWTIDSIDSNQLFDRFESIDRIDWTINLENTTATIDKNWMDQKNIHNENWTYNNQPIQKTTTNNRT